MSSELDKIHKRQADVKAQIEKLQKEQEELSVAARVLERLSKPAVTPLMLMVEGGTAEPHIMRESQTPRPDGIPTTPDMITELLRDAHEHGTRGLSGKQLAVGIAKRWWPGVGYNAILPTAHRMVTEERLVRVGNLYALPHD